MRAFFFFLAFSAMPALTIQMCADGFRESDGRCFYISDVERSFGDAIADCQSRGGSLAVIDTEEERDAAMEGVSRNVPYWISRESEDLDYISDADDLNCYICEALACPAMSSREGTCTVFDYGATVRAFNDLTVAPGVAEETGIDTFVDKLSEYREYDGAQLAELPDASNFTIMGEHWALTYSDPASPVGITTVLSLPETRDFDPKDGLPAEFPSAIISVLKENYPKYYNTYGLSYLESNYAQSRATTTEFDEATYGPDARCPYPSRTDLGSGFTLQRPGATICLLIKEIQVQDPISGLYVVVGVSVDFVCIDGDWYVGTTYWLRRASAF